MCAYLQKKWKNNKTANKRNMYLIIMKKSKKKTQTQNVSFAKHIISLFYCQWKFVWCIMKRFNLFKWQRFVYLFVMCTDLFFSQFLFRFWNKSCRFAHSIDDCSHLLLDGCEDLFCYFGIFFFSLFCVIVVLQLSFKIERTWEKMR